MVSLSAAMGYLLAAKEPVAADAVALAGVFLLSGGASVLNQIQERRYDALMRRTRFRPIPAGTVSLTQAWCTAGILIAAGESVLGFFSLPAAALGLVTLFWYNGVYTPLKRVTPFAVLPGALVGAVPPVIGWVLGGGVPFDRQIGAIAFFFFLWQIPHFWLLLLVHPGDYERAGFPSVASLFSRRQLVRIVSIWMLAAAVACLVLPIFGAIRSPILYGALVAAAGWLVWNAAALLRRSALPVAPLASFRAINLYAAWVAGLVVLDKLLGPFI
jgi:protoheme IX farnesyltransferase